MNRPIFVIRTNHKGSFTNDPYKTAVNECEIPPWTVEDAGPYNIAPSPGERVGGGALDAPL